MSDETEAQRPPPAGPAKSPRQLPAVAPGLRPAEAPRWPGRRSGEVAARSGGLMLWSSYLTTLEAAIERAKGRSAQPARLEELAAQLGAIRPGDWTGLHLIDHLLVDLMDDDEIRNRTLYLAGLAARSDVAINEKLLVDYAAMNGPALASRSHAILADLFEQFGQRDLKHQTRRDAAALIARDGWWFALLLVAAIVLLATRTTEVLAAVGQFHLALVVFIGCFGAYVSQLIGFYQAIPTVDYRMIQNRYSRWSLMLRYMLGGFAAFVLYLLVTGQLLAGDMFPDRAKISDGIWGSATGPAVPSVDFAKLLVWSFIAGFSERLLTEQLTRIEGAGAKG